MNDNQKFNELTNKFDNLVKKEKLNIETIENLMIENIENYKKELKTHMEDLLKNRINEKELISKKNVNGKNEDLN